jgi:hypothetical protein
MAAIKKWAKLTRDEWEMVKEVRTIRAGNEGQPVQWFTVDAPPNLANVIAAMIEDAREAYAQKHKGDLVALIAKAATDPVRRRGQYQFFMQAVQHAFGPHSDEEVPVYYGDFIQ